MGLHQRGVRLDGVRLQLLTVEPPDLISVATRTLLHVRAEDVLEFFHFRILGNQDRRRPSKTEATFLMGSGAAQVVRWHAHLAAAIEF